MTKHELKDKIVKILEETISREIDVFMFRRLVIFSKNNLPKLSDALISAGIGDVSEYKHRTEVAELNLEKYKRALNKVIKDRNILAEDFYYMAENKGQLYEDYYLGWVEHEMQEERKGG